MIIGILSDTHDRVDSMVQAMKSLAEAKAEFYIHCGDVGGERILDQLADVPSAFVFGNNDWNHAGLRRYAERLGIACHGAMGDLKLGGKSLAVLHGDDFRLRQRLLDAQAHDYLLQGHTHVREDERVGRTRVINPGALHRARPKTVAVLDTAADILRFLIIAR